MRYILMAFLMLIVSCDENATAPSGEVNDSTEYYARCVAFDTNVTPLHIDTAGLGVNGEVWVFDGNTCVPFYTPQTRDRGLYFRKYHDVSSIDPNFGLVLESFDTVDSLPEDFPMIYNDSLDCFAAYQRCSQTVKDTLFSVCANNIILGGVLLSEDDIATDTIGLRDIDHYAVAEYIDSIVDPDILAYYEKYSSWEYEAGNVSYYFEYFMAEDYLDQPVIFDCIEWGLYGKEYYMRVMPGFYYID